MRERITMETKSASAASPAAAVAVSQRDQMTANDGSFHPHQQQNQQQRITQHRPTVPPKPAAFRDDSQHQQHQHQHQHRSAAVALSSSSSSSPRRLPLVDLTSRIPSSPSSDLPSPQPQQLPPTPQTPLTPVSPFYQQPGSSPQPVSRLIHQHQQQPFDDEQFTSSYRLRNASVGKSEDDSNDSDESEDTFQDFDDLRDFVKPVKNVTTGQLVLVPPESIDAFELIDDDGEEEEEGGGEKKNTKRRVVQLTERQKKSLENRLSTFSMRIKNKQAAKTTNLRDLFKEPNNNMTKQTYVVTKPPSSYDHDHDDQHNSEEVDGNGQHQHHQHNRNSRPVSTIFDVSPREGALLFKPGRYPQLGGGGGSHHEKAGPRNSSNVVSSTAAGNGKASQGMYSPSNLARFQSTPNIASPDLYGGNSSSSSPNKRIDALKSQGKNIQQKFKNLFVRKQNRKNFNLNASSDLDSQISGPKRRTNSTNHDVDQDNGGGGGDQTVESGGEPQELIIPPRRSRDEQNSSNNNGSENHRSSVYLHQTPQVQHRSSGRIDTDVDFTGGVEIRSIRYNASYRKPNKKSEIRRYELLEAQPIEASVDLAETLSDYGVIFCIDGQHLKSFSLRHNINYIDDLTRNYTSAAAKVALLELAADLKDVFKRAHDVKMPRFKDERKKANSNLVFGGYLTQLHQLDRKRNPQYASVDCPSLLHHLVSYVALHGIHEEGIFRVTGAQSRLKNLKNELAMLYQSYYKYNRPDDRQEIYGILEKYSPFDVAGVLKLFLRELTQPLFTNELMEIFLKIPAINRLDMKIKMLNLLMLILNDSHRNSLSAVLQLFHLVVQNEAVNKMSLDAVCTVMAPNLMTEQQTSSGGGGHHHHHHQRSPAMTRRMSYSSQSVNEVPEEMAAYLRRTTNSLAVCKLLINLHPLLFHIPPYIYRQVKKESY